jgi:SAM-dependent methyltransferase
MAKGRESGMPHEESWESFFDVDRVLQSLECDRTVHDVVEFGCGYGTFTLAAARIVHGMVHALDIESEMVDWTQRKAAEQGCANVCVQLRDFVADGSGLSDSSLDYAMLFNILHIEDPVALLREAYRSLRPGGRVGIIHWNYDSSTPRGPSMAIRPKPEQCEAWARQAGFEQLRADPLTCCPHHYGLVARRPEI